MHAFKPCLSEFILILGVHSSLNRGWDSPVNKLHQQVTQGLSKMLADPAKPFCSHYGAVAILTAIGVNVSGRSTRSLP